MKKHLIIVAVAAISVSLGAGRAAAQGTQGAGAGTGAGTSSSTAANSSHGSRLNPLHWVKKGPKTASDQLNANSEENNKLTSKLRAQGLLPAKTDLKDACSAFKDLGECVASLHASHNLKLNFNCMKWDLTGVQAPARNSACKAPPNGKGMSLSKAIHELKPDANARAEAKYAEKQAQGDIKAARS